MHLLKTIATVGMISTMTACATVRPDQGHANIIKPAEVTSLTSSGIALRQLPKPKGSILVGVYNYRDLTGQYKPSPSNGYSTVVTQGASAILLKALLDSGWFKPLEREGLNDLLTERKIHAKKMGKHQSMTNLLSAPIIIEGGVIGYDQNVRTGGAGAAYLGVGASTQYREDQVTINLRVVDVQTGEIVHSVNSTKSVFSRKIDNNLFRFVRFKEIAEFEAGYSYNEPAQLCVSDAIESALINLIVDGIRSGTWALKDPNDIHQPVFKKYLEANPVAAMKLKGLT